MKTFQLSDKDSESLLFFLRHYRVIIEENTFLEAHEAAKETLSYLIKTLKHQMKENRG